MGDFIFLEPLHSRNGKMETSDKVALESREGGLPIKDEETALMNLGDPDGNENWDLPESDSKDLGTGPPLSCTTRMKRLGRSLCCNLILILLLGLLMISSGFYIMFYMAGLAMTQDGYEVVYCATV